MGSIFAQAPTPLRPTAPLTPGSGVQSNLLLSAELAARSGPRHGPMFTVMPSTATGVVADNRYADPKMWAERYQEFAYGEMGTGIAIGDYDGDGRPDLFVVSKSGQSRLFRNLGEWKFEDVTEKAGLKLATPAGAQDSPWSQGAVFVDVNNDGRLDLYVCRFGAPNLLFINQGNGTFREEAAARGLAVIDACGMAAFCDYDRDGWLDVYIHTNMLDAAQHPNGQRGYLFHNKGDGTFENVSDRAGIKGESATHSATWWDYNNDGWPDLYVANDYAAPDVLYRNNRDGTFSNVINDVMPHLPYYGMGADIGDVDNDGRIDLLVSDMAPSTHEKDHRGMAGSRARAQVYPEDLRLAPQSMHNMLYLNRGVDHVLEAANLAGLAATDWTWSVRWEDLDNDGRLDLFVTNGMNREYHNADLLAQTMAAESAEESRRVMERSPKFAETHFAYRNLGDLQFEAVGAAWGLDQKGVSFGAAFADLDGDGDLDLVYANYQDNVTLLRNDSDSGHRLIVALRGKKSNSFGVGATVRIETDAGPQVRQLVLARGYLSSSEPILHFGLGENDRVRRLSVSWPSGVTQTFADLAADRKYTITEPDSAGPLDAEVPAALNPRFKEVSRRVNFSFTPAPPAARQARVQPLQAMDPNCVGPFLAVGALDQSGVESVFMSGRENDPIRVAHKSEAGKLSDAEPLMVTGKQVTANGPLLVFDADGDGANDLIVTSAGTPFPADSPSYQPQLFLNDGRGNFRLASADALPALHESVGAVAAADFNRDGKLDLFVGARIVPGKYPLPPRSALWVNHGGKFEDITSTFAPGLESVGMVTSAVWSDVDGDGWMDLLVTLEWGGVRYWHNRQGTALEDWSERAGFAAAGTGWWRSLAVGDFNGDGQLDYAVGNVGLNTPYRASSEAPALLFYGEFGNRGRFQMIEAYYEGGRLFPRRTRAELGAEIPSILKRYPKNDAFAKATLDEILGAQRLAEAKRFQATEFRSGVFLSQGDGRFEFKPFPRIAQISPLEAMVCADFDGDGQLDLCAVQNSDAPVPSIGRFDGGVGQWLRGDGHGNFAAVSPQESGIVVPGDASALALYDFNGDGWADLLVARNRLPALAFQNEPHVNQKLLAVILHGEKGNADAIGARITLEMADGSKQTREVNANCGGGSQSSTRCAFGFPMERAPRLVRVRWPSGAVSEQRVSEGAPTLTLNQAKE